MDILSTLLRLQTRSIGVMVPDVVISEKHSDTLEITEHPVEVGSAINDHAYKRPSEVTMECGFAGAGSLLDVFDTRNIGLSTPLNSMSPKEVYKTLLDVQARREPLDVVTGKRTYKNMLIRAIEVTTDKTSENVLNCTLTLREIILTSTTPITVADKADMAMGVHTAPVIDTGTKSLIPVNESVVNQIVTFLKPN
ncbi:phage baseplate protein [Serratia liquefaciens]|uniref:phage baseplate protein n=1 Tax=Serratia liquefaciens TaxID=614 RepID=UPI003905E2DF